MTEQPDIVDRAERSLESITPGKWRWRGNTDHQGDVCLHGYVPGKGFTVVLGTVAHPQTRDEAAQRWYAEGLGEFIDLETYIEQEVDAEPVRYLAFGTPDHVMVTAREHAQYAVAVAQGLPKDTPREHPQVYRGDVDGVNNANAEFIAEAPDLVRSLVQEVRRLREMIEAL